MFLVPPFLCFWSSLGRAGFWCQVFTFFYFWSRDWISKRKIYFGFGFQFWIRRVGGWARPSPPPAIKKTRNGYTKCYTRKEIQVGVGAQKKTAEIGATKKSLRLIHGIRIAVDLSRVDPPSLFFEFGATGPSQPPTSSAPSQHTSAIIRAHRARKRSRHQNQHF